MANKIYILTVEYDEDKDEVEYIQEEIVDQAELQDSTVLCEILEEDYWNENSLELIKKFYSGEVGES